MDDLMPLIFQFAYQASALTTYATTRLLSVSEPLKRYLAAASASNPDLTNLALMLVILYLSLSIVGMAGRYVYSLVMGVVRLVLFFVALAAALWVYSAGLPEVLRVSQGVAERVLREGQMGAREGFGAGQEGDWGRARSYGYA